MISNIVKMNNKQLEFLKIVIDYFINLKNNNTNNFVIHTINDDIKLKKYGINTCGGKSLFTQINKVLDEL
jgi:hypothetical protein